MEVQATRVIAATPAVLYAFLAEPDRHWQLLGRRLEPLRAYDGERSQVRLRGPLGVRRTLWIRFASAEPGSELVGRVEAGSRRGDAPRTIGTVRWSIRPVGGGTAADADTPGREANVPEAATSDAAIAASDHAAADREPDIAGSDRTIATSDHAAAARSEVVLTARTEVAGWLDRVLLACGGARWLRQSLELALARLDERVG